MIDTHETIARPEWRLGVAGPDVAVRYRARALWVSASARAKAGAWLKNVGAEAARNVSITDLIVDEGVRCRFRAFGHLEPGQLARIDPVLSIEGDPDHVEETTLFAAISRAVVRRALRGEQWRTRWLAEIAYEDVEGRRFVTRCEIELAGLPLTLTMSSTRQAND